MYGTEVFDQNENQVFSGVTFICNNSTETIIVTGY